MKRLFQMILCFVLLSGCSETEDMDDALALRSAVLQAKSCEFSIKITADYGDKTYAFSMDCVADKQGNVTFTVREPQTIAGITGSITSDGGNLTFDDTFLAIPMLTDDQITPVSAPWLLMRTLRGGYITASCDGRITINDSYADDALTLDIYLNSDHLPKQADVYWKNRRILTIEILSFALS